MEPVSEMDVAMAQLQSLRARLFNVVHIGSGIQVGTKDIEALDFVRRHLSDGE